MNIYTYLPPQPKVAPQPSPASQKPHLYTYVPPTQRYHCYESIATSHYHHVCFHLSSVIARINTLLIQLNRLSTFNNLSRSIILRKPLRFKLHQPLSQLSSTLITTGMAPAKLKSTPRISPSLRRPASPSPFRSCRTSRAPRSSGGVASWTEATR